MRNIKHDRQEETFASALLTFIFTIGIAGLTFVLLVIGLGIG